MIQYILKAIGEIDTYWSDEWGWTGEEEATIFTEEEMQRSDLPMGPPYGKWEEAN